MRVIRGAGGIRIVTPGETDARARAAEIVAAAHAAATGIRADALAEGFAAGRAEALAGVVAARCDEALAEARGGEALAAMVCEVTVAVLGREAEGGLAVVRDVTARVLARVRRARGLILRVHPAEADGVRAAVETWLPEGMALEALAVEPDETVGRGGVIAETELGRVDGRLEVQLAAFARALAVEASKR